MREGEWTVPGLAELVKEPDEFKKEAMGLPVGQKYHLKAMLKPYM